MKQSTKIMRKYLLFTIVVLSLGFNAFGQNDKDSAKKQKLTSEEIINKHLASIGSSQALAAVKSRIMVGTAKATSQIIFTGQFVGPAQFASFDDKVLFAMIFNSTIYPYEKAAYDGQNITVGKQDGDRSVMGDFLKSKDVIFKQGLMGGVLSTAWPLLDVSSKKAKISYAGAEKINNRQVYKLKYLPSRGGDLNISLYFDAETFQHIRTEYQYVIPAPIGATPEESIRQLNRNFRLTEDFSDFSPEGQLTLPHTYAINLTIDAQVTKSITWVMKFNQFIYNQPLDAAVFHVS